MKKRVTILTPVYNEEEVIELFHRAVTDVMTPLADRYDWDILFINDGSTDSSLEIMRRLQQRDPCVGFVNLSRNFGKEIAMLAGMEYAGGDAVVTIDADLQEPPEVIPKMIARWEEGFDDVYGSRLRKYPSAFRRFTSTAYHRLLAGISRDMDLTENSGDFRLLDRKCVDALIRIRETQRYTKGLYALIGFRKCPVEYDIKPRAAGKTKWNTGKLIKLAVDGITSHSVMPLRLASMLGIITSITAFIYLIYVLMKALIKGDPVAGYPTLMCVILFLGGFILLALGIIGEYLGRVFIETKRRPPYFVSEACGNFRDRRAEASDNDKKLRTEI